MTRAYTLKRRAAQQAETRGRIVEAAVDLHGSIGPAKTTISMIAERAGVQRHTVYSHFPDERSLFLACSGRAIERDPLPDAEAWRRIRERRERVRAGLRALYAWYERNAGLVACVLRDSEFHALTREVSELRMGSSMSAIVEVLGAGLSKDQRAMLQLAISYHTWRCLVREAGMDAEAAADAMVRTVTLPNRKRVPSDQSTLMVWSVV
jgi:AcrR family transcriptional regulator